MLLIHAYIWQYWYLKLTLYVLSVVVPNLSSPEKPKLSKHLFNLPIHCKKYSHFTLHTLLPKFLATETNSIYWPL